jgi:hypothetical protein
MAQQQAQQFSIMPASFSLNIKRADWLGGQNVHNTITIVLLLLLVIKARAYKL